ncbi:MAG: tetraacyldisaccharide 4'-kinase [Bacteroidia bacterium]|nr:tetraacyldisaccharide 4'-kinase [Bacteroidia bacterium]GIV23556.1 MAG: tetraacyldisaccharide 4'-kinase [Bacteroidia bacterium]
MWRVGKLLQKVGLGIGKLLALPIALVYGVVITVRNWLYDRKWLPIHRLPCQVVSIGNLTLGGSGKTPFALYLLDWLRGKGVAVAYLSRGYGRQTRGYVEVSLDKAQPAVLFGDEACLIKARLPEIPVAVCENRYEGGQKLLQTYPHLQILVLDDAFQHRKLHRDIDILLVDAAKPPWKDWLFPLGRLREPLRSYRRAHFIVLNKKENPKSPPKRLAKASLTFEYVPEGLIPAFSGLQPLPLSALTGQSVLAFCGIATPKSFFALLKSQGAYLPETHTFPDHAYFSETKAAWLAQRYKRLMRKFKLSHLLMVTTEKDIMRLYKTPALAALEGLPLYALRISMRPVDPEKAAGFLSKLFAPLLHYDHARSL